MKPLTKKIVLLFLALFLFQCEGQVMGDGPLVPIQIGDSNLQVEVAATPQKRQRGLMYRSALPDNEGMLFVFPETQALSFWMKNTLIPLDIGFFDEQGFLIEYKTMQPDNGKKIHTSSEPAKYALEMNQGWFKKHGIKKYDRLSLPQTITAE